MVESLLLAGALTALLVHPFLIYGLYRWLTPTPDTASGDREAMVEGTDDLRSRERRIPGRGNE